MNWALDGQAAAFEESLAFGEPQRVGWFRFYFDDQRWEWSDEVHRMHGYQPGTVQLTTEVVLSHKHPEDRDQVAKVIRNMIDRREAFSTRHRIVDTSGVTRDVVVVGDPFCDDDSEVVGTHGFYVDVTPMPVRDVEDIVSEKVAAIAERRGAIDQTKGMLMLVYDLDADAAFNVLRSLSQMHNVKLGRLAQQIALDFRAMSQSDIPSRSAFDRTLFSAAQRAADPAEGDTARG